MKCADVIRLAGKEIRLEKYKLLLGLLLWSSLLTVSLCIYRFSFSFRDCLYQYLGKYEPTITSAEYISEDPLEDLNMLQQIGLDSKEISMLIQNNSHLKFFTQEHTEIEIPFSNIVISNRYDTQNVSAASEGRLLTSDDDTADANVIVINKNVSEQYGLHCGDPITVSLRGQTLRTLTVIGITAGTEAPGISYLEMQLPVHEFLSMTAHTGVYCYAYMSLQVTTPAAYYQLRDYLKPKGIILNSEFEQGFEMVEIVSEIFWMIALICMLLAVLSMINYCSIFIAERKAFIVLLKTLGMTDSSISGIFYSFILGLFFTAYAIAFLLQNIVYLHFQTVFTSILKIKVESVDHFVLFALICFLIELILVSVTFFTKIGTLIRGENIAAVRLQDH